MYLKFSNKVPRTFYSSDSSGAATKFGCRSSDPKGTNNLAHTKSFGRKNIPDNTFYIIHN